MKYSKEKYIYSHELMYLSVIKQKQTVFIASSLFQSANINVTICFKSV